MHMLGAYAIAYLILQKVYFFSERRDVLSDDIPNTHADIHALKYMMKLSSLISFFERRADLSIDSLLRTILV